MRYLLLIISVLIFSCQKKTKIIVAKPIKKKTTPKPQIDSLSFIFMGDIMGHKPQITAAYDAKTKSYDYAKVFSEVCPIIESVDIAVANLEVTLPGSRYSGYPNFRSPDALAVAARDYGIDALLTSNNHSCDSGKKGILRTIKILDSLHIKHTGTFKDSTARAQTNLLIFDKKNIKVGLLNYTYGTNGIPIPKGVFVNLIDTLQIKKDILDAKKQDLDKLILMMHWGNEYQSLASKKQKKLAKFIFDNGVDIIVGSHPHVLQPMEYSKDSISGREKLIAYSLGNYVSNQRPRRRDGGAMFRFTLQKEKGKTTIKSKGYYLTYIYKPIIDGKQKYVIIPCTDYEANDYYTMDALSKTKFKIFVKDSRKLFKKHNVAVTELKAVLE
jgi:poly-gamma-glutamate synthesis protein (capsule biosynthesis protein)